MKAFDIRQGGALDLLRDMPDESVHCCVTSPPYFGLRDYGCAGQIGLEKTPELFIASLVEIFREVRRVLRSDGTCWVNMGDSYNSQPGQRKQGKERNDVAGWKQQSNNGCLTIGSRCVDGLKPKDLIGVPWMLAFALRSDGWYLRQDIIWQKKAPMPESVQDRCTKAHEYIFLLTKSARYFYDHVAIMEPLSTAANENYPARAKVTGRGTQGSAEARGNDRGKSGGFPPSYRGSSFNKGKSLAVEQTGRPVGTGPREEAAGRNKRSVWTFGSSPTHDAHFATFPLELPETCILAGSSGEGCCSACGAPWRRQTDRTPMVVRKSGRASSIGEKLGRTVTSGQMVTPPTVATTGWRPSCGCNAGKSPCTVLDPFSGSGTTGLAALKNGRNYIGLELNPEYVEISHRRADRHCPLLAMTS